NELHREPSRRTHGVQHRWQQCHESAQAGLTVQRRVTRSGAKFEARVTRPSELKSALWPVSVSIKFQKVFAAKVAKLFTPFANWIWLLLIGNFWWSLARPVAARQQCCD